MKVNRIDLDDDEMPESATVTMTMDELAVVYRLTGSVAPLHVTTAAGRDVRWGTASIDVADCVGRLFNRFYDDGVNDYTPRFGITEIMAAKVAYDADQGS